MGTPYMGEVKMTSFNFAPKGWALANGQLLPINQNQALFSLYGTNFGGDGRVNFALPDIRGRVPIHRGNGHVVGEKAGQEAHTLTTQEMPQHNHFVVVDTTTAPDDVGNIPGTTKRLAASNAAQLWHPFGQPQAMNAGAISPNGGSQPHQNMMPSSVISMCVALQGVFPSPN
ncbi:MAG TPA: tail fiber protein [Thermoleophilaceae bacterium]|nr:tail fiber protein [Thermoleophilaceae bacterium]